ncbi:MAG: response regulator [Nitrospirae bacterium]|nr:response regulator [Nitrospirota bacterium]
MERNDQKKKATFCILIVDDDIFCRTALSLLFEKDGFSVSTASSGEEALVMIMKAENKYDLVFVDLEMPGMSGFKLVKKLKKDHVNVPVFVVSGYQDKMMIIEMLNRDCNKVFVDMANKQGEYACERRTDEN